MHATPHVTVGKKQVKLDAPSHVPGVVEGNAPYQVRDQDHGRSTGVNPKHHEPIDPAMPKLTPA